MTSDRIFSDSRLARIYDDLDGDRRDLDHYEAIIDELGARRVLDVGCGTGTLACRLARRGIVVVGVDPAQASLDVARRKPGADAVTWRLGNAGDVGDIEVDVATMTGNVAQVFIDDAEWAATLRAIHASLRPGGHLVVETRDPAARGWEVWNRTDSIEMTNTAAGPIEHWADLLSVDLPLVTFRWTFRFLRTGEWLTSDSTLRFRDRDEVADSLAAAGFVVESIRDAPDRSGLEFVFVARRA